MLFHMMHDPYLEFFGSIAVRWFCYRGVCGYIQTESEQIYFE
jgi:hypothetical protein